MKAATLSPKAEMAATAWADAAAPVKVCRHCATRFRPANAEEEFCCPGCAFVYEMITGEGLDRFYELKGSSATRPVQNLAFEQRDYAWLKDKCEAAEAQSEGPSVKLELGLGGASCAGCVWLIERLFSTEPGALQIYTDATHGTVEMRWERGRFDLLAMAQKLQRYGYTLCPLECKGGGERRDPLVSRLGLCAAFAMNAMAFSLPGYLGMPPDFMFASLFQLITALSATLALAVGGSYFIRRAWQALHQGILHVDVPIALGIVLAYTGSLAGWLLDWESMMYFDFVAIFVFLMLGGRWLQDQALRRNQRRLFERDAVPRTVRVQGANVPLEELQRGQIYEIKPNQIVPVASRILGAPALLGMEWIQGESGTREQACGSIAASGAIYRGRRPIELEARETWAQSLLCRLTQSKGVKAEYPMLQRILKVYLLAVLVIGLLGGAIWTIAGGELALGLQVTLSIFVISCPCALGIAVPLADEFALCAARKMGVFVQQLSFWSRLRRVRHVLFDKTGTLTLDTPRLMNPEAVNRLDEECLGKLAGMVAVSSHPICRSLTEHLTPMLGVVTPVDDAAVDELPGMGLRYTDASGNVWELVRPEADCGAADVVFRKNGGQEGVFRFQDTLRDGAAAEISRLEHDGLQCHILSGDRRGKVARLAASLDLPRGRWRARMTPDEKAARVIELDRKDTLFIGDGANDSLAFDRAYVTATPAFDRNLLTDKADCYFVTRGLDFFTDLLRLARRRQRVIMSVFLFAVTYNIAAIAVCLAGQMNPLLAAVLMPISSVVTTGMVALGFRS